MNFACNLLLGSGREKEANVFLCVRYTQGTFSGVDNAFNISRTVTWKFTSSRCPPGIYIILRLGVNGNGKSETFQGRVKDKYSSESQEKDILRGEKED
jgi:hypothetical protein